MQRQLLTAIIVAATALLGLGAPRQSLAQSTPPSPQIQSAPIMEEPEWITNFKAGNDGVFNADTGLEVYPNITDDGLAEAMDGKGYFTGVLKRDPWRLDKCSGALLGNVFMPAELDPEFTTIFNDGYVHQVLLANLGENGFDLKIDTLEDVRAVARNGYCGQLPPNKHFDSGTLDHEDEQWRVDMFGLFPYMWGSRSRTFIIDTYVDRLAKLFDAHRGYDTQVQGEYEAGSLHTRGKMWTLDRAIFVQPDCCGKKVSTLFFPFADSGRRPLVYLPAVFRAPASENNPYGTTIPVTPGSPTATDVPDLPLPPTATPALVVINSDPADTGLDSITLDQAQQWAALQQASNAQLGAQLVGFNGGLSLCNLRAVGTEDGGGVITDTSRIVLEGQWGDRLHGLTPNGFVRLSYPANVSPGRPAFRPCSMAAATNSNNKYDVVLVVESGETYIVWMSGDRQILPNGGIVAGERQGSIYTFWVATGGPGWPWLVAGDGFGFSKIRIDVTDRVRPIVTEEAHFPTLSPVYVAGLNQGADKIHLIEYEGILHTMDLDLKETAPAIDLPLVLRPEAFELRLQVYRGVLHHMSLAQDDKHIVMGSGRSNRLIVIDLESRTSWLAGAPEAIDGFYVGVAFNPYEGSPLHLLAAHTGKFIHLLQPTSDWRQFVLAGRFELPFAALWPDNYLGGPQLAVAWTGPNDLAVSYRQPRAGEATGHKFEFVGLHVDPNGQLSIVTYYDLDWDPNSHPNGLAQCNGPKCNIPLPTATPTAPPTLTPPATNTPLPTATHTPEPCVPRRLRADIVLVADVSSSMESGTKLADLKLGLTQFVNLMEDPNKVAIVWFARTAGLNSQGLTTDKAHLRTVISSLRTGIGTSIDEGLKLARSELSSSNHVIGHSKVVILFSDGRNNGGDAIAQANLIKAEGGNIFTIGLGIDVDRILLTDVASDPSQFHFAPSSSELAGIYAKVAADIPCPTPLAP